MTLASFYRRKRVLLTGHTGFKGTWLARWLDAVGADVTGLALPGAASPVRSCEGDIRDLGFVSRIVAQAQPEIVFHLAAQPLVRRSYQDPVETYAVNVLGTVHVLEAARQTPSVRAVVVVTSDKCYENREWCWGYREDDSLGGHDPYSSSKACAELVSAAYRRSFGTNGPAVATVRAGNVIGGGDFAEDRIIPDVVRSLHAGRPIHLRRPSAVRPWQHVLEPLHGYLLTAERLFTAGQPFAQAWNFGPRDDSTLTVRELVDGFLASWGEPATVLADPENGPHEAGFLKLDWSKARSLLGWQPVLSIDETLRWTAEWYRLHMASPDAAEALTGRQIDEYMARLAGGQTDTRREAA